MGDRHATYHATWSHRDAIAASHAVALVVLVPALRRVSAELLRCAAIGRVCVVVRRRHASQRLLLPPWLTAAAASCLVGRHRRPVTAWERRCAWMAEGPGSVPPPPSATAPRRGSTRPRVRPARLDMRRACGTSSCRGGACSPTRGVVARPIAAWKPARSVATAPCCSGQVSAQVPTLPAPPTLARPARARAALARAARRDFPRQATAAAWSSSVWTTSGAGRCRQSAIGTSVRWAASRGTLRGAARRADENSRADIRIPRTARPGSIGFVPLPVRSV